MSSGPGAGGRAAVPRSRQHTRGPLGGHRALDTARQGSRANGEGIALADRLTGGDSSLLRRVQRGGHASSAADRPLRDPHSARRRDRALPPDRRGRHRTWSRPGWSPRSTSPGGRPARHRTAADRPAGSASAPRPGTSSASRSACTRHPGHPRRPHRRRWAVTSSRSTRPGRRGPARRRSHRRRRGAAQGRRLP